MNKTTFTKGPWASGWVGERPHGAAVVWIPDSSTCNERVEVHTSNARANARLIAAAPELFKVLQAAEQMIGGGKDYVGENANDPKTFIPRMIRAILAKVEGEK